MGKSASKSIIMAVSWSSSSSLLTALSEEDASQCEADISLMTSKVDLDDGDKRLECTRDGEIGAKEFNR